MKSVKYKGLTIAVLLMFCLALAWSSFCPCMEEFEENECQSCFLHCNCNYPNIIVERQVISTGHPNAYLVWLPNYTIPQSFRPDDIYHPPEA